MLALLVALIFPLSACSKTETPRQIDEVTVVSPQLGKTAYVFKTSEPGLTTVKGELLVPSPNTALPDPNDAIFLVAIDTNQSVSSIPDFEIGTVPQADVDETTGKFVFTNIDKGTYVVMVLTMGGSKIPAHPFGSSEIQFVIVDDENLGKTIDVEKISIP